MLSGFRLITKQFSWKPAYPMHDCIIFIEERQSKQSPETSSEFFHCVLFDPGYIGPADSQTGSNALLSARFLSKQTIPQNQYLFFLLAEHGMEILIQSLTVFLFCIRISGILTAAFYDIQQMDLISLFIRSDRS